MTLAPPRAPSYKRLLVRLAVLAACTFLGACAGLPVRLSSYSPLGVSAGVSAPVPVAPAPVRATADPAVIALRAKLAEGAKSILGATQLVVRGRRFTMDCTGVVLAVYWYAGMDLAKDFSQFSGNGVERIYKTLERANLLYSTSKPLVGDIIFWDNTYDHNEDGRWDDPLSHTGMVTGVDPDGTIAYVHYHVTKGIRIDYMNLKNPAVQTTMEEGHVKVINSPMRLAVPGQPHPPNWLAGQLYRALGLAYLLQ
jgi:hypothetical protein